MHSQGSHVVTVLSPLDRACTLLATVPISPSVYLTLRVSCYLSSHPPCYFSESSSSILLAKIEKEKTKRVACFKKEKQAYFYAEIKAFPMFFHMQGFLRPGQHEALTWPLGFLLACEYATPDSTVVASP